MTHDAQREAERPGFTAKPDQGDGTVGDETAAGLAAAKDGAPAESGGQPDDDGDRIGTFYAFRYPNFRLLWSGDLFTAAAMWIQQTALSWVVYELTGSGQQVGAINAVRFIPTLFGSPISGAVSDRFPPLRIISVAQIVMFLLTFGIAVDLALGTIQLWHLFVFTIFVGGGQIFGMTARQTVIFELVPRRVIPNAIALGWLAFSLSRSVGPFMGGALIVAFGSANNFFLQSVAYLGALVCILLIRAPARAPRGEGKPFFQGLRDGYGYAFRDPLARMLVVMSIVSPLLIIPLHATLLPIFAEKSFDGNAGTMGILAGSIGFGGLFGGLLAASLNHIDRRGMLQLVALFVFSLSETAFSILAYLTGNMYIAVPFLALAGVAESVYATNNMSMLQLSAPEHLRGSMAAVLQFSFLFMPIGSIIVGTAADSFGAPAVGAATTFTAFLVGLAVLLFSPRIRDLRLSQLTQGAPVAAGTGHR